MPKSSLQMRKILLESRGTRLEERRPPSGKGFARTFEDSNEQS